MFIRLNAERKKTEGSKQTNNTDFILVAIHLNHPTFTTHHSQQCQKNYHY